MCSSLSIECGVVCALNRAKMISSEEVDAGRVEREKHGDREMYIRIKI